MDRWCDEPRPSFGCSHIVALSFMLHNSAMNPKSDSMGMIPIQTTLTTCQADKNSKISVSLGLGIQSLLSCLLPCFSAAATAKHPTSLHPLCQQPMTPTAFFCIIKPLWFQWPQTTHLLWGVLRSILWLTDVSTPPPLLNLLLCNFDPLVQSVSPPLVISFWDHPGDPAKFWRNSLIHYPLWLLHRIQPSHNHPQSVFFLSFQQPGQISPICDATLKAKTLIHSTLCRSPLRTTSQHLCVSPSHMSTRNSVAGISRITLVIQHHPSTLPL